MKININDLEWMKKIGEKDSVKFELYGNHINSTEQTQIYNLKEAVEVKDAKVRALRIEFEGKVDKGAGACLYINGHPVPIKSTVNMPLEPPIKLDISLEIMSESIIEIDSITFEFIAEELDLAKEVSKENEVLIITPAYPNANNLYLCGFAHARVREYIKTGMKLKVAAIDDSYWYQTDYEIDGVSVFKGKYADLKTLIAEGKYKTIVTHFVNEKCFQIFDGYRTTEHLIFINHGAEMLFEYAPLMDTPYFSAPLTVSTELQKHFDFKKQYIKKYAVDNNSTWIFVSDYLHNESKKLHNISFNNTHIIHNLINEKLFPYNAKTEEDRKNILIIRKFDNLSVHSIDQSVLAILELSRREIFNDLTFNIYGDGNYFEELIYPIKDFKNVNIYRKFLTHEQIKKVHGENGILMLPSRHDSHAVSMSEGASSGLVVLGSNITSNGDFMNVAINKTLAHPEKPTELADIIERLYKNPKEYLQISERMSKEIQERCGVAQTVNKEIMLIEKACQGYSTHIPLLNENGNDEKILTIIIPAYNIENYIHKCLFSLLNHRNAGKTEILVINDGSTDRTCELALEYEKKYPKIVRVIDKENGGHGSTINVGIAEAKGTYFRIIDGDDWVDSENLAKQVDRLEKEVADVVLTDAAYEYVERADLPPVIEYTNLKDGVVYNFDDLTYPNYGFSGYGPILSTSTYRTQKLRDAQFKITEKSAYVDMEFNAFSLSKVDTLTYYKLDIYRYLIGRVGQTVSKDFWAKKYIQHKNVIINLKKFVEQDKVSDRKRVYIIEHLIAPMIDSQVFMYGQLDKYEELDKFLKELKTNEDVYRASLGFIEKRCGDSWNILQQLKSKNSKSNVPPNVPDLKEKIGAHKFMKKSLKAIIPYGIIRIYQKKKYNM